MSFGRNPKRHTSTSSFINNENHQDINNHNSDNNNNHFSKTKTSSSSRRLLLDDDNSSNISMTTTPNTTQTRSSQRRELDSLPEGEEERLILEQRQSNIGFRSSSSFAKRSPTMTNRSQQQPQQHQTCYELYIKRPVLAVVEYFVSFSFIGLLLSYSGFMCFFFALVLLALQPPTITKKVYYHDPSTNVTTTTSTTAAPPTTSSFPTAENDNTRIFYPVKNPSAVLASLQKLHREKSQDFIIHREEEAAKTFAPQLKVVGANPSHFYTRQTEDEEHVADQEDYSQILHLLELSSSSSSSSSSFRDESNKNNNNTNNNNNTANMTYYLEYTTPINFINAVYMSVTSFSASGLSSVNYAIWGIGPLIVLIIIMTVGDIVLLTMLPAVIRYRALSKEREKLIHILELTGAYHDGSSSDGNADDDSRSEDSQYYDETQGMYVNRAEFLKTHPHAAHHFRAEKQGEKEKNLTNEKQNTTTHSSNAVMSNGLLPSSSAAQSTHNINNHSSDATPFSARAGASHKLSAADARRRATMILYDDKHTTNDDSMTQSTRVKKKPPHLHHSSIQRQQQQSSSDPNSSPTMGGPAAASTTTGGSSELASPLVSRNGTQAFQSSEHAIPHHDSPASPNQHQQQQEHSPREEAESIAERNETDASSKSMKTTTPQQHPTSPSTSLPPNENSAAATAAAAARLAAENEKLDEEERRAAEVAAQLTFGKRIVYEDGLAHVNQQIDICLIIIFGVFFYWAFCHIFFTLMCFAGGKSLWWSFFHVVSAFNNAGLALSPDNMTPINHDVWLMFIIIIVMPMGNTLFPVFFRFQMSLLHRLVRRITRYDNGRFARSFVFGQPLIVWQHSVRLFLRYPRKYYTHMFSKRNTLILFLLWLLATTIGFLLYIPEFDQPNLFSDSDDGWTKFWVALFQTVSVRTTGFAIMNLDAVSTGHLAWWILAMYTSAYPFIIIVRGTANENADEDDEASAADLRREATSVVGRDLFWLYLAVMLIAYGEHAGVQTPHHTDYSLFLRICFEVSSAFGNVGLSLPMAGVVYSYSGSMSTFSTWVMIAVMFCGKHRNLPRTVDEAIAIRVRSYDFSTKELDPDRISNDGAESFGGGTAITGGGADFGDNKSISKMSASGAELPLLASSTSGVLPSSAAKDEDDYLLMDESGRRLRHGVDIAHKPSQLMNLPKTAVTNTSFLGAPADDVFENSTTSVCREDSRGFADFDQQQGTPSVKGVATADSRRGSFRLPPSSKPTQQQQQENDHNFDDRQSSVSAVNNNAQQTFSFYLNEKGEVVRLTRQELFERRVRAFYEHYNPARLSHLDRIISAFKQNPNALLKNLGSTYGREPGHSRALSAEAAMARMNALKGKGEEEDS